MSASAMTSPEAALLSAAAGSHGFDDIGFAQPSGVISSVAISAGHAGGRYEGKAIVTTSAPHGLSKGQAINITGTTDYDGVNRVLHVVSTTRFILNKTFTITKAGAWDSKGGDSAWVAFMPIGADVPAASFSALTFHYPNEQSGDEKAVPYTKDKMYFFPGIIKTILLITAGNIRLYRHSDLNPGGKNLNV
jgi:hypothetical protein